VKGSLYTGGVYAAWLFTEFRAKWIYINVQSYIFLITYFAGWMILIQYYAEQGKAFFKSL
jgi:hypothetical protein